MSSTLWQQRIRRAENLATEHPFAAEILEFYIHTARFQEGLYQSVERDANLGATPLLAATLASFPEFLAVVEEHGPERLAQIASGLRGATDGWPDLVNAVWSATGEPASNPEEFLALAFLQPYAEFVRSRSPLQVDGTPSECPFCNRKPALAVLRQQGDGGQRNLICGFCLNEWEFRRIVCPGCGEENHAKLPVYTAETFPYIRVECCDTCHTYIKSIDLTKNGLAEPLVDELASVPLNLWAQEHGYAKLHPNQLGM